MRHFLRIDGGCSIGPSLGATAYVEHGDTIHLDENNPDEARVAEDVSRASSGWLEVDENGAAMEQNTDRTMPDSRRHRFASATAEVTEPGDLVLDDASRQELDDLSRQEIDGDVDEGLPPEQTEPPADNPDQPV